MKRSSLLAVAAAALAVVTLAPASTATAAPGGKGPKTSAVVKADKRLATEQRKVTSSVATKDAALRRVKVDRLPVGATEVAANVAADRAALGALKDEALAATTVADVRLVGARVNAVRPEVYAVVVNGLRQAVRFEQVSADNLVAVTDLAAQADAKELEGFDVTGVRELLAAAALANDEAAALVPGIVEQGLVLTAFSPREARDAFTADLEAAGDLLDSVEEQLMAASAALAAMVPATVVEPAPAV